MEKEKEVQQFKNRLKELAQKSFQQNMFTFTGFLGLSEQDIFFKIEAELRYAGYCLEGGIENADRKIVRFGSVKEFGYNVDFPIVCVHIEPLMAKFADKLSHRDFLGALINLGIDRSTLGDILVGNKEAYVFCMETIAEFICQNLVQVKHTHVKCSIADGLKEIPKEEAEIIIVQVASLRIDAVIAKVYNKSRNDCLELFRTGKVFVNGRLCENNSRILKAGEIINARGYGKFILEEELGMTKKGKVSVKTAVYR